MYLFKVMKGKNLQLIILHPAKLTPRCDREIRSFIDNEELGEFSTTKPVLQQMLKSFSIDRKEKATTRNKKITNGEAHP